MKNLDFCVSYSTLKNIAIASNLKGTLKSFKNFGK